MKSPTLPAALFRIILALAFLAGLSAPAIPASAVVRAAPLAATWMSQFVQPALGESPLAAAVDGSGAVHLAYYSHSNLFGLHHTWFDGKAWQDTWLGDMVIGSAVDMVTGSDGQIFIVYDNNDSALKLAAFDGTSWSTSVITQTVSFEPKTAGAIALDDNGRLHVSFFNRVDQSLHYGVRQGSTWQFTRLQGDAGRHSSIAIDPQGNPQISFCGVNDLCAGLRHASFDGTTWNITNITTAMGSGEYNELAFGLDGLPIIAAYEDSGQSLKLFKKTAGGSWETVLVEAGIGAASPIGLAVDASGTAHLAYRLDTSGDLRYAQAAAGVTLDTPAASGDVGYRPALALDLTGKPVIAHQDSTGQVWLTTQDMGVDLQVTDVWNKEGKISFQVLNAGLAPAPAGHIAKISINILEAGTHTFTEPLAPGSRATVHTAINFACATTTATVKVLVDSTGLVAETDETNNQRSESWRCSDSRPAITAGPAVSGLTTTSATITWTTDLAASSYAGILLRRGTDPAWSGTSTLVTDHSVTLTGLSANTTYEARVKSSAKNGLEVISPSFFFTTPSGTFTRPSPKSSTVERTARDYESYALRAEVTEPANVARMDFYMDGVFVGSDYSPNGLGQFEYEFVPGLTGMPRADWFGEDHLMTSTAVLLDGSTVQQASPFNVLNEPMEINLVFNKPAAGHVLYTPANTMPPGSNLPVELLVEEFGWHCSVHGGGLADPDASPLPCGDQSAPVAALDLYLNDALKASYRFPGKTLFNINVSVDGLVTGRHTLKATATASDGTTQSFYQYIDIVKSDTPPQVSHTGYMSGAYVVVQVTVTNPASAMYPIEVNKVYETAHGLQWVPQSMTLGAISGEYDPSTRNSWITLTRSSLKTLNPGQSMMIEYRLAPILYEDMHNVTYWLNKEAMAVVDYTVQGVNKIVGVPSELALLATTLGTASFNGAIQQSMVNADYLIVTNPAQLFLHHDDAKVETLLAKMAELAVAKQGVLGYLDTFDDGSILNELVSEGSPWFARLNEVFEGDVDAYLLLVGDLRIIASDRSMSLWMPNIDADDYRRVHHTDNMYAFVSGDGRPDLVVGRLIGSVDTMITTLQTSLDVFNKANGRHFNKLEASFVSGSEPHEYLFEQSVRELRDTADAYGHISNELYFDYESALWYYEFNFEQFDGVAACDLDGDGDEELVHGDRSSDQFRFINPLDGTLIGFITRDFEEGDALVCGDVDDDGFDEIIHGDRADKIFLFDYHTGAFNHFSWDFMAYDQLAVGNVLDSNPGEEIVMADRDDYIYVFSMSGAVLLTIDLGTLSPAIDFMEGDKLAVGNVMDGFGKDEIVIASREDDQFIIFGSTGAILARLDNNFEYGEDIAIDDVFSTLGGVEEIIFANRNNYISVYQIGIEEGAYVLKSKATIHSDFEANDRIVTPRVTATDTRKTIIEFMRGDQVSALDTFFPGFGLDTLYNNMNDITADLLLYRGHGNVNIWADVMNYSQVRDFGNLAPVVVALTCLSGDYPGLEDTNMAASVLKHGAGLYIGATETSVAGYSNQAAPMFLTRFFSTRPAGADWTHLERQFWGYSGEADYYYYFVYEFNLYGDPKFGNLLPTLPSGASSSQSIAMPDASQVVDIPDYIREELDGNSYFSLPASASYLVDGQPVVPTYLAAVDYPAGTLVQDVVLSSRVLSETLENVLLPVFDINMIDGLRAADKAGGLFAYTATSEDGWMPALEQPFTWQVTQHSDGSSTLEILIYPMEYSPATLMGRFYNQFTFEIATASTSTEITSLTTSQVRYLPGDPVEFELLLNNSGTAQDLTVVAEIRRSRSTDPVGSIPFELIKGLSGEGRYTAAWDTSGVENGQYLLEVSLYDSSSQLVAKKFTAFNIGRTSLDVENLSAPANRFKTGQDVTFTLSVRNTGDEALQGTAHVIVSGPGGYAAALQQPLSLLNPGAGQPVNLTWNTAGVPDGAYTINAYVSYDSGASASQSLTLVNAFKLFLPLQQK